MKAYYSLDGGETYLPAKGGNGIRVRYEELDIPGEDEQGHLLVNCTNEGLILDVWVDRGTEQHNIGTSSEMVDEIVERLVEESA